MKMQALVTDRSRAVGRGQDTSECLCLTLDLLDRWQRHIAAEVLIRRDTVEVHCAERPAGVVGRGVMRDWLRRPAGVLAYGEIAWMDLGHGGVAVQIDDVVPAFVLRDHVVDDLRSRV